MDPRTRRNLDYLDIRYRRETEKGGYFAHEPVYGVGCNQSEPYQAAKIARAYSLFRRLAQMQFESLLDVGGSEGYHANLARQLFSSKTVTSDVSFEANLRAREFFGLPAVASDAHWLPYPDESFDVVLCCEVLEHVSDPVAVICEVARVARHYAVFTTEQTAKQPREREIRLLLADAESPHAELHWFLPEDFAVVLGGEVLHERQGVITARLTDQLAAGREPSPEEIKELILEMTQLGPSTRPELGILLVKTKGGAPPLDLSQPGEEALLDAILAQRIKSDLTVKAPTEGLDPFLRERLACPVCLGSLADKVGGLVCAGCGRSFPVDQGVPRMYLLEEVARQEVIIRWPWLSDEGKELRKLFTAPREGRSRLLCYLLSLELALLGVCRGEAPAELDYANSTRLRRALEKEAAGYELPEAATRAQLAWWDKLPASAAEVEAMRELGANVLELISRVVSSEQIAQPQVSLARRAVGRLKRSLISVARPQGQAAKADILPSPVELLQPTGPANRGEVAVLIARMMAGAEEAVPECRDTPTFPDMQAGDPRRRHVEYVLTKGVMFGYADGLFHPEVPLNRGELAVLLARALAGGEGQVPEATGEPSFTDVSSADPARKHVEYLLAAGVVTASADGRYHPNETVDREEVAKLLARAAVVR